VSQGEVTCFELDTQHERETLRIQRLGRLVGVEFWSIFDTDRRRTIVSKAFSATLAIAGRSKGRATGWARGQERVLEPGAVQLADPGEVQHLGAEGGPISLFVIRWSEEALSAAAAKLGLSEGLQWNSAFLSPDKYTASVDCLYALLSEGARGDVVQAACVQVTTDLLLSAGTSAFPRRNHGGHPTIRRAIEKMKSGLSETASLGELAAQARLSKFHFARSFRKTTGLAPHQYRKLLRVEQARRLLEGGLSVTDTAQRMGFSDASHLVRSFRDCLGVAPGVWAKAWRASDPSPDHTPTTILPPPDSRLEPLGATSSLRPPALPDSTAPDRGSAGERLRTQLYSCVRN
jgi:AraC-like DNA-binding protein